jgi:hypothetical protein
MTIFPVNAHMPLAEPPTFPFSPVPSSPLPQLPLALADQSCIREGPSPSHEMEVPDLDALENRLDELYGPMVYLE